MESVKIIGFTNLNLSSSAHQDVNIYVMDSGFNFDYDEYFNTNERITKYLVRIQ